MDVPVESLLDELAGIILGAASYLFSVGEIAPRPRDETMLLPESVKAVA
jgi:hypothetical protein